MHVSTEQLVASLRNAGMRVTQPRQALCQVLSQNHQSHLTATDLLSGAEELLGKEIDLSTVYRTIWAWDRAGLIRHVHLGHGPAIIHLADGDEHHHLICEECGKTVDFPYQLLDPLASELFERYGYKLSSLHFGLMGRCPQHN